MAEFTTTAVELQLQHRTPRETGIQFRGMNFHLHSLRPHIFRLGAFRDRERKGEREREGEKGFDQT